MTEPATEIILAQPRGFCAGVERAIEIVEQALIIYGPPIYVRHEIVHNRWVVEDLKAKGVIFVDELDEIPDGAITIFSAHGVSEQVESNAAGRGLEVIDATCPLVTKVHNEAIRYEKEGREIVLIGHEGHPEVEGTSGRVAKVHLVSSVEDVATLAVDNPSQLAYVTQTTLSVDDTRHIIEALQRRFPDIKGPSLKDICYATQNRQNAVKTLAAQVDVLVVIGSPNSSNSNRLRDLGEEMGVTSYLVNDETELNAAWFSGRRRIGLTAGASAPQILVDRVIGRLIAVTGGASVKTMAGEVENVRFKLPPQITRHMKEPASHG